MSGLAVSGLMFLFPVERLLKLMAMLATIPTSDDTAAGEITFEKRTTHSAGIFSDDKVGVKTSVPQNDLDVYGAVGVKYEDGIHLFGNTAAEIILFFPMNMMTLRR